MARIIINADGAIYGRLCSYAAKQALEGNEIVVVNSEKSIITGSKSSIIKKHQEIRKKGGSSRKGPKHSRFTYRIMKKGIKGMLPDHRGGIGKEALKRIMCYDGIPKEFEGQKMIKTGKLKHDKYIELRELSKKL